MLGNLPAARQTGQSLVISDDANNGAGEKTSLLEKISEYHQAEKGDSGPEISTDMDD